LPIAYRSLPVDELGHRRADEEDQHDRLNTS
jgi:hypothetical protein